ncbi:MAG: diguanylate cyclase [Kineosporiaceae bacterium]
MIVRDPVIRCVAVAGAGWLVLFALGMWWVRDALVGQQVLGQLVYLVPIAAAVVLSILVARRRRDSRWFWRLLAVSNGLWLAGDLVWAGHTFVLDREVPFPSWADAAYLTSYALVPVAVVAGFRAAGRLASVRGVLDAAVIAVAVGFAGWELLVRPQLGAPLNAATLTGIAYPLAGVAILVTLLAVVFSTQRAVPLSVVGVAVAFAIAAVTDIGYTWLVAVNSYVPGGWLNLGWQLEAVVMCLALLVALRHDEAPSRDRPAARDLTLVPALAGVGTVLAVVGGDLRDGAVGAAGVLVALAVLVTLVVRFAVSTADLQQTTARLDEARREQERLAVTDMLTGLYNRRFISEMLSIEVDRAHRGRRAVSVVTMDIDHFKRVNDTCGHAAGDTVLVEVARRLSAGLRSSDVLARVGGEEFLVVAHDTEAEAVLELAERLRLVVRRSPVPVPGAGPMTITVSAGVASVEDGDTAESLAQRADRALYAAKDAGRDRVMAAGGTEHEAGLPVDPAVLAVLERVADTVDRRLGPDEHSAAVARWSVATARAMGLSARDQAEIGMAARLHDVGKLEIPDAVLQKRGPLDGDDWQQVHRHPVTGADMLLGLVPPAVAELVRTYNERVDGDGYPFGTEGARIPLGARILAVCDAYSAMRGRRPYSPALTESEAITELRRCAGTQFDPAVVETFVHLVARGRLEPLVPLPDMEQDVPDR